MKSGKTLAAFLKEHNADKNFQFEDYNAAVADRNLTSGLAALFQGNSGPNFRGATGFKVQLVSTTVTQSFPKWTTKHPNQQTNVKLFSGHCSSLT
jgi:hypothetical protein